MHIPQHNSRPARRAARLLPALSGPGGRVVRGVALVLGLAGPSMPARAEQPPLPLPLPLVDFALDARTMQGGEMKMAHHEGKMRVEVARPGGPGMLGIIDMKGAKMIMIMPQMPNMAVEIELPPDMAMAAMAGTGHRVGQDKVAGEACDLWQVDNAKAGPTVACITSDGIALRTQAEIKGAPRTVFEATRLDRSPQKPENFALPEGVKLVKVPKNALGGLGGVPGLGRLMDKGVQE